MSRYTILGLFITLLLLVVACGQDTTEPDITLVTDAPEPTVVTAVPETVKVPAEPGSPKEIIAPEPSAETTLATAAEDMGESVIPTEPADEVGCPEGQHAHDGEGCHPDDTLTGALSDEAEMVAAPKVVLEEQWWRPGLGVDAVGLTAPAAAGADRWNRYDTYQDVPGTHPYDVFFFFHHQETDSDYNSKVRREEAIFYQLLLGARDLLLDTDWVYFPYRYDLSWAEYPTTVRLEAAYPLGEEIELLVSHDGQKWDLPENIETPEAPPIRPTTPFAEPRWPDTATQLGRDCPPVEDLWEQGKTVEDPCTLEAIHTALTWVWAAPTDLRQRAIRDGPAL